MKDFSPGEVNSFHCINTKKMLRPDFEMEETKNSRKKEAREDCDHLDQLAINLSLENLFIPLYLRL